jgi:myo-inositol 2-dehydrogenase/D-chiro-inositol 1-dehydrogenase
VVTVVTDLPTSRRVAYVGLENRAAEATAAYLLDQWLPDDAGAVLVTRGELQDPLLVLFEMADGVLVDVEVSVNIHYGYEIRCEVSGETGTVELAEPAPVTIRREGTVAGLVPGDWRERFALSYDVELREWVDSVAGGRPPQGPSAWDGYVAQVVSDAALQSLHTGSRVAVELLEQPALYR